MNPDIDNETRGTTHAATNSPNAHDTRTTTERSMICLMPISVGLGSGAVKNRVTRQNALVTTAVIALAVDDSTQSASTGPAIGPRPMDNVSKNQPAPCQPHQVPSSRHTR